MLANTRFWPLAPGAEPRPVFVRTLVRDDKGVSRWRPGSGLLLEARTPGPRWHGVSPCDSIEIEPEEQAMKADQSDQAEPFPREPIPPEILEWARQTFDEAEFLAQVREMLATGGLRLEDFIAELEARARSQ